MNSISELSTLSQIVLYALVAVIAFITIIVAYAQVGCIRGRPFKNPDGTVDDWREQKIFYGIAWADLIFACPLSLLGVVTVFVTPRIGLFILAGVSVWFVWSNIMTTVTSLRFEKPRISMQWLIVFPFGLLVGLGYIVWMIFHFKAVYG
jgi:hypothetical protein